MPIYEYILLALLTSGANAQERITLTLGPEAIVQPNGSELRIAKELTTPKPNIPLPKLNKPLNKPAGSAESFEKVRVKHKPPPPPPSLKNPPRRGAE